MKKTGFSLDWFRRFFKSKLTTNSCDKGFTLVELMIAVTVIVLVTVGSVYTLMYAHYLSEESRGRLLALNAARSVLEEIKETPIASVPAITTTGYVPAELPGGAITITTNPASVSSATIATVTVTVSWNGPRNRAMSLSISTMRSSF